MANKAFKFLRTGVMDAETRNRILRILSIAMILVAVGGCVILVMAFVWQLEVIAVAFSGVTSVALASYLFIKLWPKDVEEPVNDRRIVAVQKAIEAKTPMARKLSPLEYRLEREKAQKMIAEKAAPALAKAIRGILQQADLEEQRARR